MRIVAVVVLAALAVLAIACDECSLTGSSGSKRAVAAPKMLARGDVCGALVGDNGVGDTIDPTATLACRLEGEGTTYNEWFYELPVTAHTLIDCVTFGWDQLGGAGGSTDLIINVYDGTVADYVASTAEFVSSTTFTVSLDNSASGSFVTYSLNDAAVPVCTGTMLFQMISSDLRPSGNYVYPAFSTDASGAGYIVAPDCGATTPISYTDIGFPNNHFMLSASGDVGGTCPGDASPEPSATPTRSHRTHTRTRTRSRSKGTHSKTRSRSHSKSRTHA